MISYSTMPLCSSLSRGGLRRDGEQQQWFAGQPDYENVGLALASDTEAYGGHLGKAGN